MLSDRDEFGASIDNSKEKLIDDDGMTKNNTESQLASLACSAVHPTYKDTQESSEEPILPDHASFEIGSILSGHNSVPDYCTVFEYTKFFLKFIYFEKATKFCEISINYLTGSTQDK